jgi:C4-dicarboxylate transporter DctM subunit
VKTGIWAVLAPVIIIGGMLGGFFTPTEAAAVATAYGLFVGFVIYQELKLSALPRICYKVLISTSTVMYIVALAKVYTFALTREASGAGRQWFNISSGATIIMLVILIFSYSGDVSPTTPALFFHPLSFPL